MSNIDQLLRRDPSDEKRPNSERRRHSALYDQIIDPRNPNPLSIINEAALDLENADTERVRAHIPGVERVSPPEAAPSVQSTAKSKALRQKLQLTLQTDMSDPLSMARRFVDAEGAGPPQIRFSADASFPVRPREPVSPNFPRSQSNPAHRTQPSNPNAKSMQKKRPPPLLTPLGGASGFAFGVGADSSGIRRISIGRENIPAVEEKERNSSAFASTSSAPKDSAITQITPMEASAKTKPFSLGDVDDGISEPKAYSKSDIWNSETDRSGDVSSGPRFSKRPSEKERDLFYFEEASQSSFGDTDSPSRIAAKNGIVPIERKKKFGEVMEDNFVFGPDESFSDGGFIISSNGLVEPPEKVSRKMSDGIAVEGVPTSSNNLIIVRSLAEFQKRFTFKDKKSEHGSSTLGRGAAGKVYLAVHEPTRRKLAVKEINIYDQDKRNQLRKELVTLISLRSRFLVRSFGACYDGNGGVHVALEYMDRGSLSDIVAQQGRIPEVVTCKIAEHCIRGLVFLHKNHILHRDVKTGNILLSRKLCRAKLSDFGLARDLKEGKSSGEGKDDGEGSSVTRTFVGTIAYMSPERLNGEEYTYASDVWGLGIAVMECIMGRYPFEKPQSYFDVIDAAQSAPATLIEGEVSEELVDFIRVSTHVDPNQRPKVSELLEHPWIKSKQDNANALKDWLDALPKLHCENVEVGAELAFNSRAEKEAKTKAKIRAKAEESRL